MTRQERYAAFVLLLLGIATIAYTFSHLKLGTVGEPGPGFFPVVCGSGITLLAVYWLLVNVKSMQHSEPLWGNRAWVAPVVAMVLISVYAATLEFLGYLISTLVFVVLWQKFIERESWRKTAVLAVVGTAVMYVMFMYLLGVPLPEASFME